MLFATVVYWCPLLNNVFIVWLCHNLFICRPVEYLDCFYCVGVCLWCANTDSVCIYLEVGLPDHSICVCSAFVETVRYFPKCWFFTSPQQFMRIPFVFHQHLRVSVFSRSIILVGVQWHCIVVWIDIFLMTTGVEYFLIYLLFIWNTKIISWCHISKTLNFFMLRRDLVN